MVTSLELYLRKSQSGKKREIMAARKSSDLNILAAF
jgi:hypothetical protein